MSQLHPMLTDPRLAHLSFTAFAEPDRNVMTVVTARVKEYGLVVSGSTKHPGKVTTRFLLNESKADRDCADGPGIPGIS
jgi:hypothetical protein